MELISRSEAKAVEKTRYFTGKPCPKGHVSERLVRNRGCYACELDKVKRQAIQNRARQAVRNARWYRANRVKADQTARIRRQGLKCCPISTLEVDNLPCNSCPYCGASIFAGYRHLDHKTPLSRGGFHLIENVQWTCPSCNDSKGTLTDDEYRSSARRVRLEKS